MRGQKSRFSMWFSYQFDNAMSRGTVALIGLLTLATLVLVFVVSGLIWVFGAVPEDMADAGILDIFWGNLMRTLSADTMQGTAWGFRLLMLIVTIGGLIIVASLISIISGAFDAKIEDLRKGRSQILVSDHSVILGWNSNTTSIVSELAIANESRGKSYIAILAPKDKVEMDDIFRAMAGLGRTRVICRTGDPKRASDLAIISPNTARSIIVLSPESGADADAEAIKTVLALVNYPNRKQEGYSIIADLTNSANLAVAQLVGRGEVSWVMGAELIAKVAVQTCRQSGMSAIYSELFDFAGDEIYFTEQPTLVGRTYFESQSAFPKCAVLGLMKDGQIEINPAPDTVISPGDQLIVIAEDDSLIRLGDAAEPDTSIIVSAEPAIQRPEHTLILGANQNLHLILDELDDYVSPGSTVKIVTTDTDLDLPELHTMELSLHRADPTLREVLESLDVSSFDHVLVLADKDIEDRQQADSRTLLTLLQLRDLCAKGGLSLNIVSEMLDDANCELAAVAEADDFIVSERLIALLLAQISENPHLNEVFQTLLSSSDSEIYLNPATDYIKAGCATSFYTILAAAGQRGETAIGYRVAALAHNAEQSYGIRLNPLKSEKISFTEDDRIIVLALGNN